MYVKKKSYKSTKRQMTIEMEQTHEFIFLRSRSINGKLVYEQRPNLTSN